VKLSGPGPVLRGNFEVEGGEASGKRHLDLNGFDTQPMRDICSPSR